ncbi:hypothetical protein EYF80_015822 [Liparis tanakae]|uniref:Uncharacterized protein n=1 Tax=Liparis tanakae TaxID=230148 RepID=A0A4Z2I869_9TELE|nr:hypothetical protein EYF80_015822 [Liparis tanakae]
MKSINTFTCHISGHAPKWFALTTVILWGPVELVAPGQHKALQVPVLGPLLQPLLLQYGHEGVASLHRLHDLRQNRLLLLQLKDESKPGLVELGLIPVVRLSCFWEGEEGAGNTKHTEPFRNIHPFMQMQCDFHRLPFSTLRDENRSTLLLGSEAMSSENTPPESLRLFRETCCNREGRSRPAPHGLALRDAQWALGLPALISSLGGSGPAALKWELKLNAPSDTGLRLRPPRSSHLPQNHNCRESLALEPYMALPASELTADRTSQLIGSDSSPRSAAAGVLHSSMSLCLYASRSGANKKSPASVDWHYMTLGNHCQKAS